MPYKKTSPPSVAGPLGGSILRGGQRFEQGLTDLLSACEDIASERFWQDLPRLVARHWTEFHHNQSPLSTLNMIRGCADEVLKIRLAQKRGMGGDDAKVLEDFQKLLEELGREETAEEAAWGTRQLPGWTPAENADDEDDEDE